MSSFINNEPPKQICDVNAIIVVCRRSHSFSSYDAVRALRRVSKGLKVDDAQKALEIGELVVKAACHVVYTDNQILIEEYRRRTPNGPSAEVMDEYASVLEAKFPECTAAGIRSALDYGVFSCII